MTIPRDPFKSSSRPSRVSADKAVQGHTARAHSKFSASGAERWFNCPGSVELSEGLPDKSSPWAEEGTKAHEVLEATLRAELNEDVTTVRQTEDDFYKIVRDKPAEMIDYARQAARVILGLNRSLPDSEVLVETRIYLDFIHPEMFGTFDGAVIDHFGTLHVFDYKYGAGHAVSPKENLQMIFYGIGLAHKYQWNFDRVRLWIIQPRIKGYDGPLFWDISIADLHAYVEQFRAAVSRVQKRPEQVVEGSWCHWCKAKSVCPLKKEAKHEKARSVFSVVNIKKAMSSFDES